jgi:hypothetical protein
MNHRRTRTRPYTNRPTQQRSTHSAGYQQGGNSSRTNAQKLRHYQQSMERHQGLAKEMLNAGDRVQAEYHYQHADHFYRCFQYIQAQIQAAPPLEEDDMSENDENVSKHEDNIPDSSGEISAEDDY